MVVRLSDICSKRAKNTKYPFLKLSLGAVHKGRPHFLGGGRGYPIADVSRLEGGRGLRNAIFENNRDKFLSKTQNVLPFVVLRKETYHIKWLLSPAIKQRPSSNTRPK